MGMGENVQNRSPCPASAFFSCRSRIVHSQPGYSSSASATGSPLSFRKFKPFSGVPAVILLFTSGMTFFFAASAACALRLGLARGVKGSLKGCAADVDVAVGGVWEEVESPCRPAACVAVDAEIGVAFRSGDEVLRKRWGRIWVLDGTREREAARRHERHIILGVRGGSIEA
jgi:hypothetical protein